MMFVCGVANSKISNHELSKYNKFVRVYCINQVTTHANDNIKNNIWTTQQVNIIFQISNKLK